MWLFLGFQVSERPCRWLWRDQGWPWTLFRVQTTVFGVRTVQSVFRSEHTLNARGERVVHLKRRAVSSPSPRFACDEVLTRRVRTAFRSEHSVNSPNLKFVSLTLNTVQGLHWHATEIRGSGERPGLTHFSTRLCTRFESTSRKVGHE